MENAKGEAVQFALGPIELELQVQLSREGGPSGKVNVYVFEIGGSGKVASAETQKVKLTLMPKGPGGGDVHVGEAQVARSQRSPSGCSGPCAASVPSRSSIARAGPTGAATSWHPA